MFDHNQKKKKEHEANKAKNESNTNEKQKEVLKVASKTNPNSLAGAIANIIREQGQAELQAIGAGAINQTIKGIAISRGYVAPSGVDLICIPGFKDIKIEGEERTAIKFIVKPR
jgi:stage V sporulation protein S